MNTVMPVWRGRLRPRTADGMNLLVAMSRHGFASILAEECQEPKPEHIKRSQESGEHADRPEHPASVLARECLPQNLVLAEESREWRESRDGKSRRCHRPKRPRNVAPQPTHAPHVLLAADGMDHRARREKQQPFEERMSHQMKNSCGIRGYATSQKHVAEL